MTLTIRTTGDPSAVAAPVRAAIEELDRDQAAAARVWSLDEVVLMSLSRERGISILLQIFALAALVLLLSGTYALMARRVATRRREIATRVALGADSSKIVWHVLGGALKLGAIGVGAGLVLGSLSTSLLERYMYGVTPLDVTTFASVAVLVLTAAAAASLVPARRAVRDDPMRALGAE